MKNYQLLLIAGIALIAGYTLSLKYLKNKAIDGCLISSGVYEYTQPENGVRSTAPQKEYYQICLADKGYTTGWR